MAKSDAILEILARILASPKSFISEADFDALCPDSKKSVGRYKKLLCEAELADGHSILKKVEGGYSLNSSMFKYFYPANVESGFFLKAYSKLGHLLKNSKADEVFFNKKVALAH